MDKQRENLKNLKNRTPEERSEIARKGGIESGKSKRKKMLISEIYAEFLDKEHDVIGKDGALKKLTGQALLNGVMSKVLGRGDGSSVRLMKEIREATEGSKIKVEIPQSDAVNFLRNLTDDDLDRLKSEK